jgi:hypothetical protein
LFAKIKQIANTDGNATLINDVLTPSSPNIIAAIITTVNPIKVIIFLILSFIFSPFVIKRKT